MQIQSQSTLLLRNQKLFYVEQWAALLLGAVCLGMSVWALLHGTNPTPDSLHAAFRSGIVSICLHWSLSIAVALTGVSLLRFAFYKQPDNTAISQPHSTGH